MTETGQLLQQRYRIDRQIGQGGMGAVYVATDERFNSTVAIKETLCMDDNYRKAIEREARLLNSLKHHALPRVTDHFEEANSQFLVMEYIPGEDLCCVLDEREEPFEADQVLDWADQLLEALDFLHNLENPVVHRDIKPQNLKVTPKGKIILLDFGLAKGNVTGAGNLTNAKSIFGYSRNYASLEQIQGTGTDPRSDLYSLAATLYHLLTKAAPEDALTRAMSVLSQKPDPLVPANQLRAEIPAGVAAILHKALDLDASERPANAAEMRQMLREHDRYADLAINTVSVARAAGVDIHSQPTRLMPANTRNDPRATNAGTNLVADDLSQVTRVRPIVRSVHTAEDIGPVTIGVKKKKFAAAAVGALLLGGAAIAGFAVFEGEVFGERDGRVAEEPAASVPAAPLPEVSEEKLQPTEDQAAAAAAANTNTPRSEQSVAKRTESARTSRQEGRTDPDNDNDNGDDDNAGVAVDRDTIYVGNMRIKDGKVYMPDGKIYDGLTPPAPGVRPRPMSPPAIAEEHWRKLTPEQQEKLRELRRRNPGVYAWPSPSPPKAKAKTTARENPQQ